MMKRETIFLAIMTCGLLTSCQSQLNHTSISMAIIALVSTYSAYAMYEKLKKVSKNKIQAKEQDATINKTVYSEKTPLILLEKEQEIQKLKQEKLAIQNEIFEKTGLGERIRLAGKDLSKEDTPLKPFTTKELPILIEALNDIYKGFSTQLKESYPTLSESELEICYLLKAGAKTKNIAAIIPMTPNAVTKKKRQIKEKMNLTNNSCCFWDAY